MNNEELIREAREFLDGENAQYYDASLVRSLTDALEATTTEWEYQWGEPGETFEGFDAYSTFEEARSEMSEESEYESHCVLRRRKAGPWVPVQGEDA